MIKFPRVNSLGVGTIHNHPESTVKLGTSHLDHTRQMHFEHDQLNILDKTILCVFHNNHPENAHELNEDTIQNHARNHQLSGNPKCLPRHAKPYSRDTQINSLSDEGYLVDEWYVVIFSKSTAI